MSKNCSSRSLNCHPILSQQNILLAFRFCFGAGPACKHESNLVHEIRNVVEHIEEGLTEVSEHEHDDGADQEPPEHAATYWLACCLEDQVELDHLQGDSDAPIHVPVD